MLTGVIFCDSDNFIAKEIKHITQQPDSHVALLFGETVLHFRFLGFESMHIAEFKEIYKINTILFPKRALMVSADSVIKHYHGRAYAFPALIYAAIFLGVRDTFGIHLPGGNMLENKRDKFCVTFASEVCLGETNGLKTPTDLKLKLVKEGWT